MFETNYSGHNKVWGGRKNLPHFLNNPFGYGPGIEYMISFFWYCAKQLTVINLKVLPENATTYKNINNYVNTQNNLQNIGHFVLTDVDNISPNPSLLLCSVDNSSAAYLIRKSAAH